MLLTDKYADKIHGIITCHDRMIIQGYIPNWSHAEAMTAYMKLNGIRIFLQHRTVTIVIYYGIETELFATSAESHF